jgi:photosystem II stability/assembly factor-like uncharacterized protein
MKTTKRLTLFFVFSLTLSACSSTLNGSFPSYTKSLSEQTGQDGRACVIDHQIRGYNVKHRDIIILDAGRKHYVATTFHQCNELMTSFQAAFFSRFPRICGGSSRVITRDESCIIDRIFEFEDRKQANAAIEQAHNARLEAMNKAKENKSKEI